MGETCGSGVRKAFFQETDLVNFPDCVMNSGFPPGPRTWEESTTTTPVRVGSVITAIHSAKMKTKTRICKSLAGLK